MTELQGVLTSAGLVAVLMGLIWRMFVHFDAKNGQAHAAIDDRAERRAEAHRTALEAMNAITANVQAVDDRAERRAEAHRATLESIARDVSFLAGRQAERASGGVASGRDARRVQDSACSPPEARDDGVDNLKDVRLWLPTSGAEMSDGTLLKHEHAPWLPFARKQSITSRSSCAAVVMLVVSLAFSVTSAFAQNPVPKEDWPMRGRTPDGWGYSPLDQINRNNVTQLQMVWSLSPEPRFQQGAPRVYDGIMYLSTSEGSIQAVDAATGDLNWEYKHVDEREPDVTNLNRDLAIYGTHITDTSDTSENSAVFALDVATGERVWAPTGEFVGYDTWFDERDPERDVVYIGSTPDTGGSCPTRFGANSREVRTYSPLTGYCMTTNDGTGTVQAISTETDTVVWEYDQEKPVGRVVATAGGLVFGGDHDGRFRAFDHKTGEVIWKISLGSPITQSPISYVVDGRQYVAIHTDNSVLFVFSVPGDVLNTDAACPLSESHSMSGPPLELYHDNPRPYWFFPFILTGVERKNTIYPEGPVIICEAVHRSTWSKRSLWLRIVAGSKRGWVNVGQHDDLEAFLKH